MPEKHRCVFKGLFFACLSPGIHLANWTKCNLGFSNFAAAYTVYPSACRLQLTSQLGLLNNSFFTRQSSNHVEMTSEEDILPLSVQDDKSSEANSPTASISPILDQISLAQIKLKKTRNRGLSFYSTTMSKRLWKIFFVSSLCREF